MPTDPSPRTGETTHPSSQPPSSEPKERRPSKDGSGHGRAEPGADRVDPVTGAGEDIAG